MSGKPAARVTDPTACPLPGHGTNPITSGSPDVFFDGLAAARQTDTTACGSALSSNVVPNVLINGLPAVTIGSVGNHGNVVAGGSGTIIIGMSGGGAAVSTVAPLLLKLPTLCLPCLLAAAKKNATFVPLENLGASQ
ncbi:PAAR domain-containing protein [Pseudomonas sp. PDM03]|uniref:PAAR domain-containing protein n=1 Tax=Pseudomonas TaxID=286 RepID=UPI00177BCD35|nr:MULTISPECIES: PAAR domain-containing protein [Pseudomonas]MBD9588001.1 PAAR domain-containing protein [Pseudomonas sp. PDM03]MCP1518038.1 putative Zn-binding protein involved in type VI secretion [Pseudomonas migulae]